MKIIVGMPAYNEEENIATLVTKLKKITNSILVCDDGSTDSTSKMSEDAGATVITHRKNLGYGAAIRSLFLKAKEMGADALVTFDADGQHRVEDVELILKPIIEDEADIVIGSRFLEGEQDNVPAYRRLGIKTITNLTNTTADLKLTDSQSGFRAYNRRVLESITPSESGMGVSTEILIKASRHKFRIKEVAIKILYDGETSTHNPLSHGLSVVLTTLKVVSIEHPLKFYGIPGIIFLAIGLFFVGWTAQYRTEYGIFHPVLALVAIGLTLFGLMFMMMAILLYSLVSLIKSGDNYRL